MSTKKALQEFDHKEVSVKNLAAYIFWVNQIPMLTREEERLYSEKLYYEQDLQAARKLILAHLRFVVRVAKGYEGYGLQLSDLIQEGNIGLMKAVKRFDPKMGVRLVSFAIHWIRAEIHEFVLRNWRIVRVVTTKAQRKLFFNLRKASRRMGWLSNDEVDVIAQELQVRPKDVRYMEARLSQYDKSLDQTVKSDDSSSGKSGSVAPVYFLEDKRFDPARILEANDSSQKRAKALEEALLTLDERSRHIISARWLSDHKMILTDLAALYKVSAERIRQIERCAMQKMLAYMQKKVKE